MMRFVYPEIENIFEIGNAYINTLVIEHKTLFRTFIEDIARQIDGDNGKAVLSVDYVPVEMAAHAELIQDFAPFHLNHKPLLTKLCQSLEKTALSEEYYFKTQELLQQIELYLDDLAFSYPCDFAYPKLTAGNLLKSTGLELVESDAPVLEKILTYMELVREYDREKLFIFVNLRSFFPDAEVEQFFDTALRSELKLLMLEGHAGTRLQHEKIYTVDTDLCEF